jgi:hypothetical protein
VIGTLSEEVPTVGRGQRCWTEDDELYFLDRRDTSSGSINVLGEIYDVTVHFAGIWQVAAVYKKTLFPFE